MKIAPAILIASTLVLAHGRAHAAPADDIQLLRTRPTGMDEAEWRKQRREVARDLRTSRSDAAVDALIEIVETERYDSVLSIAMESLAELGDPKAIPALQRVYADRSIDTFVREEAGKAIEALGGTPRDDARLTGEVGVGAGGAGGAVLEGPQLGTMGEASAPEDVFEEDTKARKPLPDNLRARERDFAFGFGSLAMRIDTAVDGQPVLADAGVGALAEYVDEREQWGWTVSGYLGANVANGDQTLAPSGQGNDDGDLLFIGQRLDAVSDIHLYFFSGSNWHAFVQAGLSERLAHLSIEDLDDTGGGEDESNLADTRFGLDIIPAGGFGWGRYLNAASDIQVDAIVHALEQENILTRKPDARTRKEIRDALYRHSNAFSTYPRLASVMQILQSRGYLARRPGTRVVHRLRSVIEDPSYLDRPRGIRARVGFLYGVTLLQDDRANVVSDADGQIVQTRRGDDIGAPFIQFDAGFQLDRERQILADTRFWYDAVGDGKGFTTDSGVAYTRFLHTKYDDYRGEWFVGVRGGVSQREFVDGTGDDPADVDVTIGWRALANAGYAFGFNRGSEVRVNATAGMESGAFVARIGPPADTSGFVVGAGLAFRIGLFRGSVLNPPAPTKGRRKGKKAGGKAEAGKAGAGEASAEATTGE